MKLLAVLVLVCVAAAASASRKCYTTRGENIKQFNGRGQSVLFPCKYFAVHRQLCGKYRINVVPGNIWHYPKYQLDTVWLDITNSEDETQYWEGRTHNKKAVKFYNNVNYFELFKKKDGTLATADTFVYGRDDAGGVYIEDNDATFRFTFTPWDPNNRAEYPNSEWAFECFAENIALNDYPEQLCGGDGLRVKDRVKNDLGMPERFRELGMYFDTFNNSEIVQTNPLCQVAHTIFTTECATKDAQVLALSNCMKILHGQKHAECVTNYQCDPMVVFNDCLRWGCTGFDVSKKDLCAATAEGIDFCPEISSAGNLSARVTAANCYTDFVVLESNTN